jgi:PAS domain S-box-containing protein
MIDSDNVLQVLLIDDNPDDRALANFELQQLAHLYTIQVREVQNEQQFQEHLESGDFNFVITDYQLKWNDGLRILRALRAQYDDVPVIMFTATGTEEIAVEAMKAGLDDYVIKSPKHLIRLRVAFQQAVERSRQQRRIHEAERRYEDLFHGVPIGLFRSDTHGQLLEANSMFARMTGYADHTSIINSHLADWFLSAEAYDQWQRQISQDGYTLNWEVEWKQRDSTQFTVELNVRSVKSAGSFYYEGSVEDITARVQVERERTELLHLEQIARHEAERANELKMLFLGMISHELRTPLSSIQGFATTLLAEDVTFSPEDQRSFLKIINEESEKLTELIDQLLDVSRLYAGMLGIQPKVQSFQHFINQARPDFEKLTVQHRFFINMPNELPLVYMDERRILQVITNLLENAVKFSPLDTPVTLSVQTTAGHLQINVDDEGEGIPPAEREVVFEPFRQVERKSLFQWGTGLGLAICKGLVEAHGGRIWIQDRPGPGTTISFTLPLADSL